VWPDWETGDTPDWLADGWILDNSPFDPVLESIQRKSVTGPWQRTLCFVVPSGDEAVLGRDITPPDPDGAAGQAPEPPPPWTSVNLGQIASDLFARSGHTGRVSHPVLRPLALIPRRLLWKRVEPGQPDNRRGSVSG
jgi:hypothetical protein